MTHCLEGCPPELLQRACDACGNQFVLCKTVFDCGRWSWFSENAVANICGEKISERKGSRACRRQKISLSLLAAAPLFLAAMFPIESFKQLISNRVQVHIALWRTVLQIMPYLHCRRLSILGCLQNRNPAVCIRCREEGCICGRLDRSNSLLFYTSPCKNTLE